MAHRVRSKVQAAEAGASLAPASLVECRRNPHAGPLPETLERRQAPQRGSDRHQGVVERAALVFRGKPALVQVANASKGGLTLESALSPDLGELVMVAMEGAEPRAARVRWIRKGRIGLAFVPA
jgi:hypothetical protein